MVTENIMVPQLWYEGKSSVSHLHHDTLQALTLPALLPGTSWFVFTEEIPQELSLRNILNVHGHCEKKKKNC